MRMIVDSPRCALSRLLWRRCLASLQVWHFTSSQDGRRPWRSNDAESERFIIREIHRPDRRYAMNARPCSADDLTANGQRARIGPLATGRQPCVVQIGQDPI